MPKVLDSEIYYSKYAELFEAGLHEEAKNYVISSLSVDPTNIPLYCLASNVSLIWHNDKDKDMYLNKATSLLKTAKYKSDLKMHTAVLEHIIINTASDSIISYYIEILNSNIDNFSFGNKKDEIDTRNALHYAPVLCALLGEIKKYDLSSKLADIIIEKIKYCNSCITWAGKEGRIDKILDQKGEKISSLNLKGAELTSKYLENYLFYEGISMALFNCAFLTAIDEFEIYENKEILTNIFNSREKTKLNKVVLEIANYILEAGKINKDRISEGTIFYTIGNYLVWLSKLEENTTDIYKKRGDEFLSIGFNLLEPDGFEGRELLFQSFKTNMEKYIKNEDVQKKMKDKLIEKYEVWKTEFQAFHRNEARKKAEMQFRIGISEKIADTGDVERDYRFKTVPGRNNPKKYGWISGIVSFFILGKIFMKFSGGKGAFFALIISITIGYFISKLTKDKVISQLADEEYNFWISKEEGLVKGILYL